jgi:hypothetical protein
MALFVARPSRGSWTFFALVALSALAARGWSRYERSVIQRDAPLSERAQELGACLFGHDALWLLADGPVALWEDRLSQWFRAVVSIPQESSWPGRCVPLADALLDKLQRTSSAPAALVAAGRDTRERLREMASVHTVTRRTEIADNESLARPLAALFAGVRDLSLGTRAGWRPAPSHIARYTAPKVPRLLRFRPIPPDLEGVMPVGGDSLLAFATSDGTAHRWRIGPRSLRDLPLASAVPVGRPREGLLRAETDQGPTWVLLNGGGSFPMPADFSYVGDPGRFAWDAALSPTHVALVTLDHGTVRLFVASRTLPPVWASTLSLGAPQAERAAVVALDEDSWRVTLLHAEASDASIRQYTVRSTSNADLPMVVGPARSLLDHVPSFGMRVATCASGAVRYIAVVDTSHAAVYQISGESLRVARAEYTWPQGYDLSLSCQPTHALLSTEPVLSRNGHWLFSFRTTPSATLLEPPLEGPAAAVRAVALVEDAVVAFVSTDGALRSFRLPILDERSTRPWELGGLVSLTYTANGYQRTVSSLEVSAQGRRIALLLRGHYGVRPPRTPHEAQARATRSPLEPRPEPYTAFLASDDGGLTFWSP